MTRRTEGRRPEGVSDATVEAVGAVTEAFETAERARGALYDFHQLSGSADEKAGHAVELLRAAGHAALADRLDRELIGRNVLPGRWTFQIVEEYDDGYHEVFRTLERATRDLVGGVRHVAEAELKERNTTPGEPGHELNP
ncbi:hypothetical protein [Actinosynnema sp. NPDC020468]|uniref:hypothetical protein n=1 Tax=Actinosynnema sp. NPDC020468 TaxID=3154488 RepID=UPI0033C14859